MLHMIPLFTKFQMRFHVSVLFVYILWNFCIIAFQLIAGHTTFHSHCTAPCHHRSPA